VAVEDARARPWSPRGHGRGDELGTRPSSASSTAVPGSECCDQYALHAAREAPVASNVTLELSRPTSNRQLPTSSVGSWELKIGR
jgi:hypothetical protein